MRRRGWMERRVQLPSCVGLSVSGCWIFMHCLSLHWACGHYTGWRDAAQADLNAMCTNHLSLFPYTYKTSVTWHYSKRQSKELRHAWNAEMDSCCCVILKSLRSSWKSPIKDVYFRKRFFFSLLRTTYRMKEFPIMPASKSAFGHWPERHTSKFHNRILLAHQVAAATTLPRYFHSVVRHFTWDTY